MKFTTKVCVLKIIVELYPELFSATTISSQLANLRKDSDLMEVIGNPKNPKMYDVVDVATERFNLFDSKLSKVEMDIYFVLSDYYSLEYSRKIAASARHAFEFGNLDQLRETLVAIKNPVPDESVAESSTAFSR